MFHFQKLLRQAACIAMVSGSLNAVAHAENMKFGYVNADRVYSESQTAQSIETNLQKEFAKQQKQLNNLQQTSVKLQQRLASGKLNANEHAQVERQFQAAVSEYRLASARFVEEYNLRRAEEFAALQNNANDIIQNIAQQEQYDLIVQEAVFVKAQYDITDRVIRLLDGVK